MRTFVFMITLIGLALFAPRAGAQESHKFNAKTLGAKYDLPIYPAKGGVVNNEVIETVDDVNHESTALYSVKGDLKKATDFFTKELGEPKMETADTGGDRWEFKKADPPNSRFRHRVYVTYDKAAKQVTITLWMREYESAADADN